MAAKVPEKKLQDAFSELSVNYREIKRSPNFCWTVFWSFVFLMLLVMFSYQSYLRIAAYCSYVTVTKFSEKYSESMLLPRVTMCTDNWRNWTKLRQIDNMSSVEEDWMAYHFLAMFHPSEIPKFRAAKTKFESMNKTRMPLNEFVANYSLECQGIFGFCSSATAGPPVSCCEFLANRFVYRGKMCFVFEVHQFPMEQKLEGIEGFAGMDIKVREFQNESEYCSLGAFKEGRICDWWLFLSDIESDEMINAANFASFVINNELILFGIQAAQTISLPTPYGTCKSGELKYFEKYSQGHCRLEKQFEEGMEKCGCVPFDYLEHKSVNIRHLPHCDPIVTTQCWGEFHAKSYSDQCPPPCFKPTFGISAFKGRQIPAQPGFRVTTVGMFYKRLTTTRTEDVPSIALVELVSQIGSLLAFWLGWKLMTMLQFFYYIGWAFRRLVLGSTPIYPIEKSEKVETKSTKMRRHMRRY